MTDAPVDPADDGQATVEHDALAADGAATNPAEALAAAPSQLPADRPEIAVGAAFAGGLALALLLKRLAR